MANFIISKRNYLLFSLVIILGIFMYISYGINKNTYAMGDKEEVSLNPEWIEYNLASSEEKEKYNIIPDRLTRLYHKKNTNEGFFSKIFVKANSYPEYYNLVDERLVTAPRNQGSTGLCWAFASLSSVESNLLKKGIASYNNPIIFSERQLDYAIGPGSYLNTGYNPYHEEARESLGTGAYANSAYILFSAGVSPVTSNKFGAFNEDLTSIKNIGDVLSVDNVEYSVDSYNYIGTVNQSLSSNDRLGWVNEIKKHLVTYGALSVNTIGPNPLYGGSCLYYDSNNNNYLINDLGNCNPRNSQNGHAMSIIGWDDNYSYEYCRYNDTTTSDLTGCTNIVRGTGAFILKNSWGANTSYPYLAYTSDATGVMGVTSVSQKNWDNNYDSINYFNVDYDNMSAVNENTIVSDIDSYIDSYKERLVNARLYSVDLDYAYVSYRRNSKVNEVIKKIGFANTDVGENYDVYVSNDSINYTKVGSIIPTYYGVQSIDVDDYLLNSDAFYVKIVSSNDVVDDINVFTSYVNNNSSYSATTFTSNTDSGNSYTIFSDAFYLKSSTTNIDTGESIYYKFSDKDGVDITSLFSVKNSFVLNNVVNPIVSTIGDIIPSGRIKIETYYGNTLLDTDYIDIENVNSLWKTGNGSRNNPFVIYDASDFLKIYTDSVYLTANYRLGNDIDLSGINNYDSVKLNYPFSGTFNGNNYTMYGLVSNTSLLPDLDNAIVGNLMISEFDINSNGDSIGLITNNSNNSLYQNIKIFDNNNLNKNINNADNSKIKYRGFIVGNDNNSLFYDIGNYANYSTNNSMEYMGGIVGICTSCQLIESLNFGNLENGEYVGGLIGGMTMSDDDNDYTPVIMNSYNRGNVNSTSFSGGLVGVMSNSYIIKSYVLNDGVNNSNYGNIIGYGSHSYIMNSYYKENGSNAIAVNSNVSISNSLGLSDNQMKNKSNYNGFDFENVWVYSNSDTNVEGYDYPYLKFNKLIKAKNLNVVDSIAILVDSEKGLTSNEISIIPSNVSVRSVKYFGYDNTIIDISNRGVIKGKKAGYTTVSIRTLDGSNISKNIEIHVYDKKINFTNYNIYDDLYVKINTMMSREELINSLQSSNEALTFEIVGARDRLATGDRFRIYDNTTLIDTFVISVLGDVTGTGTINVSDVAKLYQYVQGVRDMNKEYQIAADVKNDSQLKVNDVAKLYQYIQGKRERLDD